MGLLKAVERPAGGRPRLRRDVALSLVLLVIAGSWGVVHYFHIMRVSSSAEVVSSVGVVDEHAGGSAEYPQGLKLGDGAGGGEAEGGDSVAVGGGGLNGGGSRGGNYNPVLVAGAGSVDSLQLGEDGVLHPQKFYSAEATDPATAARLRAMAQSSWLQRQQWYDPLHLQQDAVRHHHKCHHNATCKRLQDLEMREQKHEEVKGIFHDLWHDMAEESHHTLSKNKDTRLYTKVLDRRAKARGHDEYFLREGTVKNAQGQKVKGVYAARVGMDDQIKRWAAHPELAAYKHVVGWRTVESPMGPKGKPVDTFPLQFYKHKKLEVGMNNRDGRGRWHHAEGFGLHRGMNVPLGGDKLRGGVKAAG